MEKINVGIIGMGFIGKLHYDSLRRLGNVHIRAIALSPGSDVGSAASQYDVDYISSDWKKVVDDPEISVIHNCTPNRLHDEVNLYAIAAGKHIYAEKPLSQTAEGAEKVCLAAEKAGIANAVNHSYRMNAAFQEMRNRIESGKAGRLLYVSGRYIQDSAARHTDYTKRRMPEDNPARALLDIGVHWADAAVCAVGMPIKRVYARMYTHYPVRIDPETGSRIEIHSDDTTAVMVEFADGTPGSAIFSKVMLGHKNDLQVVVSGENCELRFEEEQCDRLFVGSRERGNETVFMDKAFVDGRTVPYILTPAGHNMGWADGQLNAVKAFYASIADGSYKTGKVPYATFRDGVMGNRFIAACLLSAAEDRWAEL